MIIRVTDSSHAGEARRRAAACAEQIQLGAGASGSLAIVVTEIVTNLMKHAGGGDILIEALGRNGTRGVRVLGIDSGPGIRDLGVALSDGHSTAGTSGNGLGAIRRMADTFDIFSMPEKGTVILADVWHDKKKPRNEELEIGVVSVPVKGEDVCGDGWGAKTMAASTALMVVDGLGHGVYAAEAARAAERVFTNAAVDSPGPILQSAHDSLRKTRGAAMAVASIHFDRRIVSFAGIGNIGASIVGVKTSRGMASHNGTLGHQLQKVQEFTFPWDPDSLLIMHSDGLNTRWDLQPYPGIRNRHPAVIAGILYRDFSRERDDVTVLVAGGHREINAS
jgi:anti-sigma regulatory factor (Ser/Thr protein kinase)